MAITRAEMRTDAYINAEAPVILRFNMIHYGCLVNTLLSFCAYIPMLPDQSTWKISPGGHNIPAKDIMRRFPRSLNNLLNLFSHRVDFCICFMNDGGTLTLVFEQQGADRRVIDQDCYNVMLNGVGQ